MHRYGLPILIYSWRGHDHHRRGANDLAISLIHSAFKPVTYLGPFEPLSHGLRALHSVKQTTISHAPQPQTSATILGGEPGSSTLTGFLSRFRFRDGCDKAIFAYSPQFLKISTTLKQKSREPSWSPGLSAHGSLELWSWETSCATTAFYIKLLLGLCCSDCIPRI